jgi:DNA polymerase-3 subunit epsilon
MVEIAILDGQGRALLDTLVNPERPIPQSAQAIHGISDAMVRSAPTLGQLWPDILRILSGRQVVIYNAAYDREFFPDRLKCATQISCAMLKFAEARGEWNARYGNFRWHRLEDAARHVGHVWAGQAHRALADAQACRSVWTWLQKRR